MVAGSSPARGANCFDRSKSSASPASFATAERRKSPFPVASGQVLSGATEAKRSWASTTRSGNNLRRNRRRRDAPFRSQVLRRDHFRIVPRRLRLRAFWQWPTSSLRNSNATLGIGLLYIARMTACDRRKRRPALTIAAMCSSRASGRGVGRPRRPAPISRPS